MADGQGLAVHADGDERVAPVHHDRGRRTGGPAVGRPAHQLVRALVDAGLEQHVAQRHAEPAGGAGVATADLVGHADQREVPLDQGAVEQVLVAEGERPVDHPTDVELPRAGADLRCHQCGVDAVELGVGCDERHHALDAQLRTGGHDAGRIGCRGEDDGRSIGGHAEAAPQRSPDAARGHGHHAGPGCAQQEPPTVEPGGGGGGAGLGGSQHEQRAPVLRRPRRAVPAGRRVPRRRAGSRRPPRRARRTGRCRPRRATGGGWRRCRARRRTPPAAPGCRR